MGKLRKIIDESSLLWLFFPSIFGQQRYESGGCKISMTTSYFVKFSGDQTDRRDDTNTQKRHPGLTTGSHTMITSRVLLWCVQSRWNRCKMRSTHSDISDKHCISGWWFGTWLDYDFPFSWECHHPWRTHIFQRGSNHQPVAYCCLQFSSRNDIEVTMTSL